jgi:hypothetical protein
MIPETKRGTTRKIEKPKKDFVSIGSFFIYSSSNGYIFII